jgi:uncharacterized protein YhaN
MHLKIEELHVYGYGKLENLHLSSISPNIQVFYGENEAGKSTMMSFIHSILFGFPTKQQTEQRYEPKNGHKYGGKLFVNTDTYGKVMIERLPGKATGTVTVYFSDGSVGGEEELRQLLQGMNKELYRSIYSFNIHGIQNVHMLKEEDLGKFLFSTSLIGNELLLEADRKITLEMEKLFKPNGKRPVLNEQLQKIKSIEHQVKHWKEKQQKYYEYKQNIEQLQQQLNELENEERELLQKKQLADRMLNLLPLMKEKQVCLEQLQRLPAYEPFPVDGLQKLEQLQAKVQTYDAQLAALSVKKEDILSEIARIEQSFQLLEVEKEIEVLIENKQQFAVQKQTAKELERNIRQLEQDIDNDRESLNLSATDNEILQLDTSFTAKERAKEIAAAIRNLKQRKEWLDRQFAKEKDQLETCEQKIKELEEQLLNDQERKKLEQIVDRFQSVKVLEKEYKILQEMLEQIERTETANKNRKRTWKMACVISGILSVFGIGLFIMTGEWGIATISAFLSLLSIILLWTNTSVKQLNMNKRSLLEKMNKIEEELHFQPGVSEKEEEIKVTLLRDEQIRTMVHTEKVVLKQAERAYEKVVNDYEEWEHEWFETNKRLHEFVTEYYLPSQIPGEYLEETFQHLERLKSRIRDLNKLRDQYEYLQNEIKKYEAKVHELAVRFGMKNDETETLLLTFSQRIEQEREKQIRINHLNEKLQELQDTLQQLTMEKEHLAAEIDRLYLEAEVKNEDEFRLKAKAYEESRQWLSKLSLIESQLSAQTGKEEYREEIDYELMLVECVQRLEQLAERKKQVQTSLSNLTAEMKWLENHASASIIHEWNHEKSIFQEGARKWVVFALAKHLLNKTIEKYRNERLPAIIQEAEQYFRFLTQGRYVKILAPREGNSMIVVRKDGLQFHPEELSQATSEQLYIALRLSLAKLVHKNEPYPIIVDDSFVNFDKERLQSMIELLRNRSAEQQILLFTCHEHIIDLFEEHEIIQLKEALL